MWAIIEKFLISEDKTLIINQVSDEIGSFYIFVVNVLLFLVFYHNFISITREMLISVIHLLWMLG